MANSLLDILNEALRVSNGRGTSQPARTLASAPTQPAQARPDIYVRNNQPRRPARRRSLWSRGFDQLNPFDNNLTWKQETPTQTKSAFQQLGQAGGQLARGAVTVPTQIVNSTAEFAGDTVDLGRAGVAGLTNNKAAMNAALNRGLQSKYSGQGQGILGTGGLITSEKAQKPIAAGDFTKLVAGKGVQGAAEVGSLVTGGFAGKQLVQQGFKQGIRSQVPVLAKTGALNAVQGGADTYNRGGNAKDIVKSAAISGVLGTAADVGLGVAGAATTKLVKSGLNAAPTKPVFADFAPKQDPSYRSAHQITNGIPIHQANIDELANQIKSKYGLTNFDNTDIKKLRSIASNPEADVKIYRASPVNEINNGDWVTTSKTYANDIKRQNGGKVYEYTVKAKDLNLPANIEDNPSLARFSAFQYNQSTNNKLGLKKLNEGGYAKLPGKQDPLESLKQEAKKIDYEPINKAQDEAKSFMTQMIDKYQPQKQGRSMKITDMMSKSEKAQMNKLNKAADDLYNQATQSQPPKTTLKKDPLNEVFQNNPVNGVNSRLQAKNISQEQALRQVPDYSKLTNEDAARPAEFNAVAATAGSKNAKKLEQQLVSDKRITDKLKEAQISGQEVNFYAKKDPNGRSVGIQQFDPTQHRIESGFVVDSNGKVLGNHIKVDETGVQVNVGGDIVNMDAVIGNPTDWAGSYRVMETMDRNIKRNAPDEATYRKTREFLIDNKIKNEANFREELRAQRTSLGRQAQDVQSVRPSGVSKDEFNSDVFDFIEGKMSNVDIKAKYGDGAKAIIDYKATTRKVYDDLLDRVNEVFAKYGEAPVLKRKDYITHINELNNKPNFAGEMFGQLQNSFLGEGMQSTRKGVPGEIAGRTETFEPRKRWNRFFQQRKGGEFSKDPFKAVDAYLEPTLYNIHMTESSVRARAIESAFRTADEIRSMDKNTVSKTLSDELDKYHNGDNAKLITGFQEFANALAGKTQRLDRQIIDTSKGAELGLRGWQQLQRIGGRGTILGNAQSVLSQTLGQPLALADTGMKNYLKGVASSLTGNTPINQSAFIKARSTKVTSPFRSTGTKILDAGGVPLEKVELAMVKNTWNAEYHKAVEKGFKGKKAILEADRTTEQVVAGRGIADQPEAYRSTAANGFLQYTLEVAANNKKFWQDLSPSQKATYVAVVFGANTAFGLVTGYEPLPDFLGATIDTAQDFRDPNDTRTGVQKAVGGAQRYASESVEMNPLATAGVNTLLNQDQRKAVFGQDSSLSRFEGTAAPVQVIRNTADAAINLTKGRYGKAASSAVKNLPFGNQTNKTVTGAAMINRGYAVDSAGNPTFPAPTDAVGRAQALLFGPNSTKAAQNFYSNNQGSVSGKTDLATLNASSNKSKTLAEIQQRRLSDNKIDKAVDERVKKVLPDAEQSLRNNPAFSKLSPEDQVKKLTKLTDDIRAVEKRKYMSDNQVGEYANDFKGKESKLTKSQRDLLTNGVDTAKYTKSSDVGELPAGMNGYDVQTLERFAGLSDTEADDIIRKEKDAEYKLTLAKYERDKKLGKISKVEDLKRSKELKRAKAGSDFEKEIREFYTLNKGEINNYVSSSPDGKTVAEKLLAYDDALVAAGVIEKNKFRDKYGNPKFDTKTSGSGKSKKGKKGKKGGKGRKGSTKGRYDYKLFAFKTPKNTQKSLRELVKKATL